MVQILSTLVIVALIGGSFGAGWNYDRNDAVSGPDGWGAPSYPDCSGSYNSPIDIDTSATTKKAAEEWKLTGWDSASEWTLIEKNYTVQFNRDSAAIYTEGGSLTNKYEALQFHFHWGASNNAGSEHTVNGDSFPMEVHFVHYDTQYADITAAVQSEAEDALAAVGFFFKIQESDNPALEEMITAVTSLRDTNADVAVEFPSLTKFTGDALKGSFYRYLGGLTTPGCNEIVQWTVFNTPIMISESQMTQFRAGDQGLGTERYRDPVSLGSRTVTKFTPEDVKDNGVAKVNAIASLSLVTITAAYFM